MSIVVWEIMAEGLGRLGFCVGKLHEATERICKEKIVLTTIIAVTGLTIASISLFWQIWTYCKTHEELVKGSLSITVVPRVPRENVLALQVEIYNDGQVPVYIKSVALTWGDEGPELGNATSELMFIEHPPKRYPLQPGEGSKYVLPSMFPQILSKASKHPKDKVWVSVKSEKKEILKLQGDDLKKYLDKLLENINNIERNDCSKFSNEKTEIEVKS